ncbi:MAG: hypothetical protein K5839_08450 [Treponemataceae bacterium]|nr:hypothetical protein [Treponemataceae bacterium]
MKNISRVKKIFVFTILMMISSLAFAKESLDFQIDKEEAPKWAYELFVKNNEKFVYKKFKIPAKDVIVYGAAEGKDAMATEVLAKINADRMALDKFSEAYGKKIIGAQISGMVSVCSNTVELCDEEGNVSYQVFCLYKISRDVWEKNLEMRRTIEKKLKEGLKLP